MKNRFLNILLILLTFIVIYSVYAIYKNIMLLNEKDEIKEVEDIDYLTSTFKDSTDNSVSFITFYKDKTFKFIVNDCTTTKEVGGTYVLVEDKITLTYKEISDHTDEYFMIDPSGYVTYNGTGFGCFPKENNIIFDLNID